VPSNLTEGTGTNLSAMIFGNFSDFAVNLFHVLDVIINPYLETISGVVRITALLHVDLQPRHPLAFVRLTGGQTT
jgi:hypothetical protein